jgi:hypothetical protein
MNRESTRKGFTTMILQKFSYPLGATCFTEKECNMIQAKFLPTVLLKMGINRSTPLDVHSCPSLYAGMTVSELWSIQGSSKNKLLIGHLRKADMVADNLQVELDCLQLQACHGTSLAGKAPACDHTSTSAGHRTFGNSMIDMDLPFIARTNRGSCYSENMTSSLWKRSLHSQRLLWHDFAEPNAADSISKLQHWLTSPTVPVRI